MNRKQKSLQRKQVRMSTTALGDDDAIYARITKHNGNRSFIGIIFDQKNNRHIPDVKMKILSKRAPRVEVPSVVNIALAEDIDPDDENPRNKWGTKNWEILVPLTDKEIKVLKKEGKISDVLTASADVDADTVKEVDRRTKQGMSSALEDLDLGIEFDRGEDEEKSGEIKKDDKKLNKHGTKKTHTVEDTEDVDVDAI